MVGAFLMPKFRKGGAYGGKQNQGDHGRNRRRYHKTSDSPEGCQFRNQECSGVAKGCREALEIGSWQHRVAYSGT